MKFVCDNCQSRYFVEDAKLANRTVRIRCKRCDHLISVSQPTEPGEVTSADETVSRPSGTVTRRAPIGYAPEAVAWHYSVNGKSFGPFNEDDLLAKFLSGQLGEASYVWHAGMSGWRPALDLPAFAPAITQAREKLPTAPALAVPDSAIEPSPFDPTPGQAMSEVANAPKDVALERLRSLRERLRAKTTHAEATFESDPHRATTRITRINFDDPTAPVADGMVVDTDDLLAVDTAPMVARDTEPLALPELEPIEELEATIEEVEAETVEEEPPGVDEGHVSDADPGLDAFVFDEDAFFDTGESPGPARSGAAVEAPTRKAAIPGGLLDQARGEGAPGAVPSTAEMLGVLEGRSRSRRGAWAMAAMVLVVGGGGAALAVILSGADTREEGAGTPHPTRVERPEPDPEVVLAASVQALNRQGALNQAQFDVQRAVGAGVERSAGAPTVEASDAAPAEASVRTEGRRSNGRSGRSAEPATPAGGSIFAQLDGRTIEVERAPGVVEAHAAGQQERGHSSTIGADYFEEDLPQVRRAVQRCHELQLREVDALRVDRVVLVITVNPNGRVSMATGDELMETAFFRCLATRFSTWTFRTFEGAPVTLERTYALE